MQRSLFLLYTPRHVLLMQQIWRIWGAAGAAARSALTGWQQQGRERRTLHTLRELDDATLRDLGLDRSEIPSIAHARGDIGRRHHVV